MPHAGEKMCVSESTIKTDIKHVRIKGGGYDKQTLVTMVES